MTSCGGEDSKCDYHVPVMLQEVLSGLCIKRGMTVVDATLGGGGHAIEILKRMDGEGLLIGIDRDTDAIKVATKRLGEFPNCRIVKGRMGDIPIHMDHLKVLHADAILADIGVSSFQFDSKSRGFSFREDAPLDMRMDPSSGETAAELLRRLSEEDLADIIFQYGEERNSRKIARAIELDGNIDTTKKLADLVMSVTPLHGGHFRIHPATRTFQAIRIAVNDELGELKRLIANSPARLCVGGRIAIISYHSLEDRMIKHSFRSYAASGDFRLVNKKVLVPSEEETGKNPRARSAKLRIMERL